MPLDKKILSSLAHWGVRKTTSIEPFDFSTLYTSIPNDLLKFSIKNIINSALTQKACYYHWLTWDSVKQLQFRHSIFLPGMPQSQMIYSSLL